MASCIGKGNVPENPVDTPSVENPFNVGGQAMPTYNDRHFVKIRGAFAVTKDSLKEFSFAKLKGGGGKGGQLMGFTSDSKFIVKEMNDGDHKTLLGLTESYVNHILGVDDGEEDPHFRTGNGGRSLLCRFYCHFYNPTLKKNFIAMNNWLPPVDKAFDVKVEGSKGNKPGTRYSDAAMGLKRRASIFDLKGTNDDKTMTKDGEKVEEAHKRIWKAHLWMGKMFWDTKRKKYWDGKKHAENCKFHVSTEQYEYIEGCIRRDCEWLIDHGLMDYSLIVGSYHSSVESQEYVVDALAGVTDNGRQPFICRAQDDGSDDQTVHVLYLGIIDFLQEWNTGKKIAMKIKFMERNKSTVPPSVYGMRFIQYFEQKLVADGDRIDEMPACPPSPLKSRKSVERDLSAGMKIDDIQII